MVDATFLFVVLFGGALVGFVAARVRGHGTLRTLLDVAAGSLGGFVGTPAWIAIAQQGLPRLVGTPTEVSLPTARFLADIYYLSPIIGGFLGVGALAAADRLVLGRPRNDPRLALLGDGLRIAGTVYLALAVFLIVLLLAASAYFGDWSFVHPPALIPDLVYGGVLSAAGYWIARQARRRALAAPATVAQPPDRLRIND